MSRAAAIARAERYFDSGQFREDLARRSPTLVEPDPDRVQVQLRCKYADCGHYDVYPFREVTFTERQTIH